MKAVLTAALLAIALPLPAMAAELEMTKTAFPPLEMPVGALSKAKHDESWAAAQSGQRAPAPSLSSVTIVGVGSTNAGGWEYMTQAGQLSTTLDHGGAELKVVVLEVGYGRLPAASMNGGALPRSAEYRSDALCINGGYYTDCNPGQTIVAWNRYYSLDGEQGGNFRYQNTSTNAPFNTLSTGIYIR